MCLMIIKYSKYWEDARSICKSKGGDLTWIQNEAELEVIAEVFLWSDGRIYPHRKYEYFHIGLFRTEKGAPLQWTGGLSSSYCGSPFTNGEKLHFSASSKNKHIDGDKSAEKAFSVCRR